MKEVRDRFNKVRGSEFNWPQFYGEKSTFQFQTFEFGDVCTYLFIIPLFHSILMGKKL